MVLFLRRDCEGGIGPAVDVPKAELIWPVGTAAAEQPIVVVAAASADDAGREVVDGRLGC